MLNQTIESLTKTLNDQGLSFDGKEENFWAMLNDPEIQIAIADRMKQKLNVSQETSISNLLSGRFHC